MNAKYKQNFLIAGKLAKEVRAFGKSLIVKGASYHEVIGKILQKIHELDAIPAFPPQIALDHVAAHFLPEPNEEIIFQNEVVKLDIGVCYQGAIGDCAVTIDLSGKNQGLIDAAEAALLAAEKSIKVGQPVREIGRIIDETITAMGYKPIKNLSGHGLGQYKVHLPPSIPNYDDRSQAIIKPGMTFAIEPFATTGKGLIFESGKAAIFSFGRPRPVHSEIAHFLLGKIRNFNGLPFALSDMLSDHYSLEETKMGMLELLQVEVIHGYPPLVEQEKGMVAQAENSVLVDEKGQIFVTTR